MTDDALLALLRRAADGIAVALAAAPSWQLRPGSGHQHHSDLVADRAAHAVLDAAGVGVLSEESGFVRDDAGVVVVVDPLDGSTNAAQGLPWYATSLCAVDAAGPRVAFVRNLATSEEFTAIRGSGAVLPARVGGRRGSGPGGGGGPRADRLADAIIGLSGYPHRALGWRQFRALGAIALDLCAVADGRLDGYLDCSVDAHGVWDYLAAVLICREAGVTVVDAEGRDLMVLDPSARRTPVAGSRSLVEELVARWPEAAGQAGRSADITTPGGGRADAASGLAP